jgi:hypothetical protein
MPTAIELEAQAAACTEKAGPETLQLPLLLKT